MIARRIAALTISVLLLQLNFTSSDLVCAKHNGDSAEAIHHEAADQRAMSPNADHDHGQAAPATADRDHQPADASKRCEIPAQSDCCQAVVSCSMTLGLAASGSAAQLRVAHFVIAPSAAETPAYLIPAPEPPPPKA